MNSKRQVLAIAVMSGVLLAAHAQAFQALQTSVPGWHFGTEGALIPYGQSAQGYAVGVDPFELHSDHKSLTISSAPGSKKGWRAACQFCRADRYRGKRVRLSAFVKCSAVTDGCGIWLRADSPTKDRLSIGSERSLKGTKQWTPEAIVMDVAPDAGDLALGPLLVGTGQVWISDLKLEIVGKGEKTTPSDATPSRRARSADQRRRVRQYVAKLPLEPTNLKFDQ